MKHALVRKIPKSFPIYYAKKGIKIEYNKAQLQHERYLESLKWLGVESIEVLPGKEECPDCVFVEDCAVVYKNRALICNMGSDYRRAEVKEVEAFFKKTHDIIRMQKPAFLEGGDVLITEERVFVGISQVSNKDSLRYVRALFEDFEVIPVWVEKTLHLKTACSYAGSGKILLCPKYIDSTIFKDYEVMELPENEFFAANCVAIRPVHISIKL